MRFAYADPPYLGCCSYYGHNHGVLNRSFDARCWNETETHGRLLAYLRAEYPDGWAISASSPSLVTLASAGHIGPDERIAAWVKPFASFKPGINPGYCWEPVIFAGGRKRDRTADTVRDYVSANITLEKGLPGAKPRAFCEWVLDLLGFRCDDNCDDLFPGSGMFGRVKAMRLGVPAEQLELKP